MSAIFPQKSISKIQFAYAKRKHFGSDLYYETAVCFSCVICCIFFCEFVFFHLDYSFSTFGCPHLTIFFIHFFHNFHILLVQKNKPMIINTSHWNCWGILIFNALVINLKSLSQVSEQWTFSVIPSTFNFFMRHVKYLHDLENEVFDNVKLTSS